MSELMDKSAENPEEDTVSVNGNSKTLNNNSLKGKLKSLRNSFQRQSAEERSPIEGSKGILKADTASSDLGPCDPSSPLSDSLSVGSPVTSPLKTIGRLFQRKEEDESDVTPQKSKRLTRSNTDPGMPTQRAFIRRSLRFFGKEKDEFCGNKQSLEEEEENMEEVVRDELQETYTPLSVMQINQLIEKEYLEDAHQNLLLLWREFQQERDHSNGSSSMDLVKKENDIMLLYKYLREKITTIVCNSNSLPSSNHELLVTVADIIQKEEKEPGALCGGWMQAWRDAVDQGVQVKVETVALEHREQNASWLAIHLALLGKTIVEDLENVKSVLQLFYPPSFRVFSVYVQSYHRVVGQHLKNLEQQATELKDLYHLLDWIINTYKSNIMGSPSLQPDMKNENTDLQLSEDFLQELKEKYCYKVEEDISSSLNRLTELEHEDVWSKSKSPEKDEGFLVSQLDMDIWTKMKGLVMQSGKIDGHLEQKVAVSCLVQLKKFPKSFEKEFQCHCSALRPQPLWNEYNITYINSFAALQKHMGEYRDVCPDEVEGLGKEVMSLIVRLRQDLENQFKEDVKPYLMKMMTRKWLSHDEDFDQLYSRTRQVSENCTVMRPPHSQEFANQLHYYVVREYIGQLMKNNYSCKNQKHEKAAAKIRQQWGKLRELFEDMRSTQDWLYPAGDELSDIIGQRNKADISDHLEPLVVHYPDFSRKHLTAVLNFRGLKRGSEHQLILQRLTELRGNLGNSDGDRSQVLFADMEVKANTDCLSNLPFFCLSILRPNN